MASALGGEVSGEIKESEVEEESGSEDEDEDSEETDESEDDAEPKLRYDRVTNDLTSILNKDCASCMAVHSKFLALGTHWGAVHILDYQGNNIRGKEHNAHTTTVNQISVDSNGDFIASCSDDGKVNIMGLYSNDENQIINFDRPVKAVALEPEFAKSSSKQFVTGDDKLVLNERGFFNRHKHQVLHAGEGMIREIKWKGNLIAWANDIGVKVYDLGLKQRITSIAKDHNHRADLFTCSLHWKDDVTLLIGWADTVKVCVVKNRRGPDIRDLPSRYVEIVAMFNTVDFFVCGISALEDNLVVLSYDKNPTQEDGKVVSSRPNLRILEPHMEYYEELSNDALSIRGYQNYRCNDYHLESVVEDNLFYIISPKDVVVARRPDLDDLVAWLLEGRKFQEAMDIAANRGKELKRHSYLDISKKFLNDLIDQKRFEDAVMKKSDIGKKFLNDLIDQKRFEDAARLCKKIFGQNKALWEQEAYRFAGIQQLKSLAPYLPRENPVLSPAIYEMVLNEFLYTDHQIFLQLIKEWPYTLYSVQTIIKALLDRLEKDRSNRILLQSLAELHGYEKAFDKALAIYLKLKHPDVFVLIYKHNLFDSISDKIIQLMEFDEEQAVEMLLNKIDHIPVDKVVAQLQSRPRYLYVYLYKLNMKDYQYVIPYAGQIVKLYAEFDRPKLLPFLKSSVPYPVDLALKEVEMREFDEEQVFLLGRMGNIRQALKLITDKIKDVDQAIEFCKEHNDTELWEDLIQHSLDKPTFITGLLNSIGTHVDPIILIRKIETGMEIPGLRDSLVKIMQDYNLQISLREGCKKILVADSFGLMNRLIKTQKKAISVDVGTVCCICQERIIVNDLRYASDITIFFCNHVAHDLCLSGPIKTCPICTTQRRGPGIKGQY